MKGILGRKIGMTQVFTTDGVLIPVTVVEATENVVLQKKTVATDGYDAVKVGFEDKREKLANKAEKGIANKANTAPKRFIKEFRYDEMMSYEVGDKITVDSFVAGEVVDVTGTSKGKGYQGVIKRHGQHIGPKGHGSGAHRIVGSMGPPWRMWWASSGTGAGTTPAADTGRPTATRRRHKSVSINTAAALPPAVSSSGRARPSRS